MKVCKNKNVFRNVMPPKDNILKFNQYMKSNKMSLFILTFNLKNSSQMCETSGKHSIADIFPVDIHCQQYGYLII